MVSFGNYIIGEQLGEGQFGAVFVADHIVTGEQYAAKIVSLDKARPAKLQREILCHRSLSHKHIVRLHEVLTVPDCDETVLILELVLGLQLLNHIVQRGRLLEQDARRIFQQLVSALGHCHECGVAHRDINLANIMIDTDLHVKLVDFGIAALTSPDELLTETCGTPFYAAPELLQKPAAYRGEAIDVWSLGVVLYAMVCGSLPFHDEHMGHLYAKIRSGKYQVPEHLSEQLSDLLARMLTVDPAKRICLLELREHPWLETAETAFESRENNAELSAIMTLVDLENPSVMKIKGIEPDVGELHLSDDVLQRVDTSKVDLSESS